MGWGELALAFTVFFVSHLLPVRPPMRPWLVARLGARGFTIVYSGLSLSILWWLISAAGRAPFVPLWLWAPWQSYVALTAMLGACLVLAFSIGRPNPFSFGGARNDRFDPRRPGLVRLTRHPLLLALALWAGAHMLANGDLAHVILFGTFAGFALLGRSLIDRRKQKEMGPRWQRLTGAVGAQPLSAALRLTRSDLARLCLGVGLYLALLTLHGPVIGVSPIP